jgi:DNA modification methylase
MYVNHLVEIFREVRRVLRDDGVLFIVIGDSYARSAAKGQHRPGDSGKQAYIYDHGGGRASSCANLESESCGSSDGFAGRGDRALVRVGGGGLKAKDLVGIPWMLAFALRADGWYLRSSIVWQKANPLPESVRDRCTSSYENVFMLSKSGRYLFDSLAIAEPLDRPAEHLRKTPGKFGGANKWLEASKQNRTQSGREYVGTPTGTRNCRDVWTISTQSSKLKFYAAFPEKLAERCILAGSSERGCCPKCGAGWVRVLAPKPKMADPKQHEYRGVWSTQDPQAASRRMLLNVKQARDAGEDHDNPFRGTATLGFRPACPHYDDRYCTEFPKSRSARKRSQRDASGDWWKRVRRRPGKDDWPVVPAVVLDCFAGSGTTLLVAQRLGRRSIGIELSESYCQMSRERIAQEMAKPIPAMGPGHVRKAKAKIESADGSQMELFDSQQTKG